MAFDGSRNLVEIDEEEHVVYFDTPRLKKITGHRIGAIFGMSFALNAAFFSSRKANSLSRIAAVASIGWLILI